jgi:hypothetical protein
MSVFEDHRRALIAADTRLSRYNPLPRILFFDDFDEGVNGWCELIGNHDGDLDKVRPVVADMRPPQISQMSYFDIGTHGAVDGTYALKLATRPRAHHMALAIKRLTFVKPGLVQFETYFTFKSESWIGARPDRHADYDGNVDPSVYDFGDFTIGNDVCDREHGRRYHCALRYLNTDDNGNLVRKWTYKTSVQTTTKMEWAGTNATTDYHVARPEDWADVPDGGQALCYNEIPTKQNWHYLRYVFDTAAGCNVELQVNDKVMDLRAIPVPRYEKGYWGLDRLLNLCVDVRTHRPVRNFLYLDSALVSVDW